MREWKVLKNGKVWEDRINSEELANEISDELVKYSEHHLCVVEVVEMTEEEISSYWDR